ncbi:MAG TPA: TrbG/VirB9 family P-type conjugative transfer protein [Bryobacteraceae bacterium]|nr:TrbG/VirB9 family P-type conjugative transfer protein [Bryobacteraceae bacterium]
MSKTKLVKVTEFATPVRAMPGAGVTDTLRAILAGPEQLTDEVYVSHRAGRRAWRSAAKQITTGMLAAGMAASLLATEPAGKSADPTPGEPLMFTMGQRKPVRIRVARGQATLIRLPEGQRVMNVYGGDKGEAGVWSVDAGKTPTRFLAVKPKETGIHTTLHIISDAGQEISFFLEEVTGMDTQFDSEIDAAAPGGGVSAAAPDVKWVMAEEVASCKASAESLKVEASQAAKKAQDKTDAAIAEYQAQYPKKLFFGYEWDKSKADKMGFEMAWSDDKFTYFRSSRVLALYEINEDGKPSLIQYSYANGVYTVPKLLYDGYFAIGEKKENKLTFHRSRS